MPAGRAHAGAVRTWWRRTVTSKRDTACKLGRDGCLARHRGGPQGSTSGFTKGRRDATSSRRRGHQRSPSGKAYLPFAREARWWSRNGEQGRMGIPVGLFELTMYQKDQGCLFGMMSPSKDVPSIYSLYQSGHLKLD